MKKGVTKRPSRQRQRQPQKKRVVEGARSTEARRRRLAKQHIGVRRVSDHGGRQQRKGQRQRLELASNDKLQKKRTGEVYQDAAVAAGQFEPRRPQQMKRALLIKVGREHVEERHQRRAIEDEQGRHHRYQHEQVHHVGAEALRQRDFLSDAEGGHPHEVAVGGLPAPEAHAVGRTPDGGVHQGAPHTSKQAEPQRLVDVAGLGVQLVGRVGQEEHERPHELRHADTCRHRRRAAEDRTLVEHVLPNHLVRFQNTRTGLAYATALQGTASLVHALPAAEHGKGSAARLQRLKHAPVLVRHLDVHVNSSVVLALVEVQELAQALGGVPQVVHDGDRLGADAGRPLDKVLEGVQRGGAFEHQREVLHARVIGEMVAQEVALEQREQQGERHDAEVQQPRSAGGVLGVLRYAPVDSVVHVLEVQKALSQRVRGTDDEPPPPRPTRQVAGPVEAEGPAEVPDHVRARNVRMGDANGEYHRHGADHEREETEVERGADPGDVGMHETPHGIRNSTRKVIGRVPSLLRF
ncbi:FAD:protein FMN transferase [Babesia caballi]|uniref:FAD:protein FMN transferase n=1 Tax=Babesia caballi TaxID=5871 RepID=A0AAV4LPP4_BABCB|nr:FAD:protein FMN transferase [Babesia caballi]